MPAGPAICGMVKTTVLSKSALHLGSLPFQLAILLCASSTPPKYKIERTEVRDLDQWQKTYLGCVRPWIQAPASLKAKGLVDRAGLSG